MKKRILSLILALSLAISLLPMTAFAGKSEPDVALGTDYLEGEQYGNVYFGSYPQSTDGEGGYLDESIRWRVLDNAATCYVPAPGLTAEKFAQGDTYYTFDDDLGYIEAVAFDAETDYFAQRDTLFLLSNDILDAKAFMTSGTADAWETATLRSWLNGYETVGENGQNPTNPYGDSFIGTAFAPYEAGVLADRAFSQGAADKVFLLSKNDADNVAYGFYETFDRCAGSSDYAASLLDDVLGDTWWLCTYSAEGDPIYVTPSGDLIDWSANEAGIGVRPALMIDLDALLFSTAEDVDRAAPFDLIGYSGGTRSLTVWDGTEGFDVEMANTVLTPFSEATVTVTSLGGGFGYSQISAMLLQDSTVLCYGNIGGVSTGDKTFDVPGGLAAGSYTLRLFAQSNHGMNTTNYAGNCVDIPVTVGNATYPAGTRVKLTDGSIWIVLEDAGSAAERFTLVKDGYTGGLWTRAQADTDIATFQSSARMMFADDGALSRLPTYDEVSALGALRPFADQDAGYWLADSEVSGFYQWTYGNSGGLAGVAPESSDGYMFAVRPVLTVLKSALQAYEPRISEHPQDIDFPTLDGEDAEFSVAATGMSLTYQWQVKEGESFSDIIGADGPTLVIPEGNGLYAEGMTFRCKLQSDWGTPVYTEEAQLKTLDWAQYGDTYALSGTDFTLSEGESAVTIHTAAGLGFLAARVNDGIDLQGVTVLLDRDIDLAGRTFIPIGTDYETPFSGHFDGGMHEVSGLSVLGTYCAGLFGFSEEALIENLLLTDGTVGIVEDNEEFSGYYIGALCGYSVQSTIRNVGIGPVILSGQEDSSYYRIGGIVGRLIGEDIKKCVYNSYSRAVITVGSTDGYAGGIAGRLQGDTIANCYFAGSITNVPSYIGGIAGLSEESEAANCYWLTGSGAACAYYDNGGDDTLPQDTGCTSLDAAGLKSSATVTALNAWAMAGNATEDPDIYKSWTVKADVNGGYPSFGTTTPPTRDRDDDAPARTITVSETSSPLFSGTQGAVKAIADMDNAFSASVEVKLTDTDEDSSSFSLGAGQRAYPFDISLYLKGTGTKVQPKNGYAVTISLPIPEELLAEKEQLKIVHKAADGTVTTLSSELKQIDGVWYIVFKATEFSPYALVLDSLATYNEAAGLPYTLDGAAKTFIGFAANGKFIAPAGLTVLFAANAKEFADTASHWAAPAIQFVTERELFTGTSENVFSPDASMTRAMFATVLGRLYERSFGKVISPDAVLFTDCDYTAYYGKYVNWATANGILQGYGDGLYGPGDPITREQMAAILYRFAQYMGIPLTGGSPASPFADDDAIPAYAMPGVNFCRSAGILTGRQDGTFAPKEGATRAEVATTVERFVEYVLK